ncbi:MAG: hypothetical protein AAF297_06610 [Planctomycetota bacterium]
MSRLRSNVKFQLDFAFGAGVLVIVISVIVALVLGAGYVRTPVTTAMVSDVSTTGALLAVSSPDGSCALTPLPYSPFVSLGIGDQVDIYYFVAPVEIVILSDFVSAWYIPVHMFGIGFVFAVVSKVLGKVLTQGATR